MRCRQTSEVVAAKIRISQAVYSTEFQSDGP